MQRFRKYMQTARQRAALLVVRNNPFAGHIVLAGRLYLMTTERDFIEARGAYGVATQLAAYAIFEESKS